MAQPWLFDEEETAELQAAARKAAVSTPRDQSRAPWTPAAPGTGPDGETCGSCYWLARVRLAKTYYKCGRMQSQWTGGGGTDVKLRWQACAQWHSQDGIPPETEWQAEPEPVVESAGDLHEAGEITECWAFRADF